MSKAWLSRKSVQLGAFVEVWVIQLLLSANKERIKMKNDNDDVRKHELVLMQIRKAELLKPIVHQEVIAKANRTYDRLLVRRVLIKMLRSNEFACDEVVDFTLIYEVDRH